MKQNSLDIAMNNCLDVIYNSNINELDKLELLLNLKVFFTTYGKQVGEVEQDKIEIIDFNRRK